MPVEVVPWNEFLEGDGYRVVKAAGLEWAEHGDAPGGR
jgi:hypothetical protein